MEKRRLATCVMSFVEIIPHEEDVFAVATTIAHFFHYLTDKEDAETADGTFCSIERDIRLFGKGRVERDAVVFEHKNQFLTILRTLHLKPHRTTCLSGIGIVHNIDHCLFKSQIELEDISRRETELLAYAFNPPRQQRDLADIVMQQECLSQF